MDSAKPEPTARFFRFRNHLKDKVGGGSGGLLVISEMALASAEAALEKVAEDYPDWVQRHIGQLRELLRQCAEDAAHRTKHYAKIRDIAFDMKGQGGTFGYTLITTFAGSLYEFAGPQSGTTDNHVEIVKAHVDAMSAVIKDRIKGTGGQIGIELTQQLNQAIAKYDVSAKAQEAPAA